MWQRSLVIDAEEESGGAKCRVAAPGIGDRHHGNCRRVPEMVPRLRGRSKIIALRVLDLVEAVMRDPFEGPGKPEPLKYVLAGCWSRRVTQEHRLVYRVADEAVDFLQARYHY